MKTLQVLFLCLVCATSSFGQKVEFAGQLHTGVSAFGGKSATGTTVMNCFAFDNSWNQTANPYGKKFALSYGAHLHVQRVSGNNLLIGAQAGAEVLRSRVSINEVYVLDMPNSSYLERKEATGKATTRNEFLNLYPYLGYRLKAGTVDLDLLLGPDIGIGLGSSEKGEATAADRTTYSVDRERNTPETDVRARVGVTAYYHHVGFSASYAHGFTNYLRGYDGSNPELYSRVLRLGLLYRL
ncbi:outer membrane beta-barrel protein [Pontibacter diazotrophicus]|nr:outer membrane beta-barrel protein [Pontibacter diazotrophicus]